MPLKKIKVFMTRKVMYSPFKIFMLVGLSYTIKIDTKLKKCTFFFALYSLLLNLKIFFVNEYNIYIIRSKIFYKLMTYKHNHFPVLHQSTMVNRQLGYLSYIFKDSGRPPHLRDTVLCLNYLIVLTHVYAWCLKFPAQGDLHLKLKLIMFCVLSQNYQHFLFSFWK